jgi:hypothetical protein
LKIIMASHVEPDRDDDWWAGMGPSDGPVLRPFRGRSEALGAEMGWLAARIRMVDDNGGGDTGGERQPPGRI